MIWKSGHWFPAFAKLSHTTIWDDPAAGVGRSDDIMHKQD
jgi:hypothetical protein